MKYTVKVDQASVCRNPDAGRQDYIEPSPYTTITLTYTSIVPVLPREIEGHIMSMSIDETGSYKITAVVESFDEKSMDLFKALGINDLSVNFYRPIQHIHSITPEPEFFATYEDTRVTCEFCKAEFGHTELEEDCVGVDDDGDDVWASRICPVCHTPECCELEFEKLW